jgi:hypothetical protein
MNRKTLRFILIFLLLFIQTIDFASSQSDPILTIEKYDFENDEWTFLVLTDKDYSIESDNNYIDQLEGNLILDPWLAIISSADEANFFTTDINEDNSTYNIKIEADGRDNEIRINNLIRHIYPDLTSFLNLIDSIFDRITGADMDGVWPVDISVGIMESYPEQYAVAVTFQRGGDMLTVVHDINFALVISDKYDANNSYEPNWILNASTAIWGSASLASGGDQIKYSFPTFILGTDTDFEHLGFMVILESGTFLKSHVQEGDLPFIGSVDPLVYEDLELFVPQTTTLIDSYPSVPAFLPFPWLMSFVSIVAIPIIRKRRN